MSARTATVTAFALSLTLLATANDRAFSQTLKAIKDRGELICGVSQGVFGFSAPYLKGEWIGFDVDFCRALAAAIFDDPKKVKFVPLSADDRFRALQAGEIDILSRNSSWTMSREASFGLTFAAVTYYDGQGFLVRRARNVSSALELDNSKVCVQRGTTTELNLADFFTGNGMKYELVYATSEDDAVQAYDSERCSVLTADASALHSARVKMTDPYGHVVLPDIISKEPLGPVVRQADPQWATIVKWTHYAMVNAEELGVSSKTIDEALTSNKPEVKRLVGTDGNYGEQINLTNDWVVRIIKHVGNYGENYERNVGAKTPLGIPRGMNQLWSEGGILYAPPIR
jgi:general L-amino acid transport system substrate-binding protein